MVEACRGRPHAPQRPVRVKCSLRGAPWGSEACCSGGCPCGHVSENPLLSQEFYPSLPVFCGSMFIPCESWGLWGFLASLIEMKSCLVVLSRLYLAGGGGGSQEVRQT